MTATIRSAGARLLLVFALVGPPSLALAQAAPPHVPLQETIGQARPEVAPSLIVMNAGGATLEGGTLTLTNPAAVLIDIIGRPLTPISYAGVARRTAYRGAWYAGAAAADAYARPACGYPPYPPCS